MLGISALFFGCLLLIAAEIAARSFVAKWRPDVRLRLAQLANRTYPSLWAYKGHPFLQYTGNPSVSLVGNQSLGDLTPFNNFGFLGGDFEHQKSPGTVRIAALGGSTTASGYPQLLEEFLNQTQQGERFEALNFAMAGYTTAHSLVNFVLNVRDFSPDYVVIHHAWNDRRARDVGVMFRNDYSHAFKHFEQPTIIDKHIIRCSVIYRTLKHVFANEPEWAFIEPATLIERRKRFQKWDDLSELYPFERNLRTIIQIARIDGTKVVLTTQPHSTDPTVRRYDIAVHIDQCNSIIRRIAGENPQVLFVDLAEKMTGVMNDVFRDVGHVTERGRAVKAEQIGKAILADLGH